MFDFIKKLFKSSHRRRTCANSLPTDMGVVEDRDIEVLKTSEYSEGANLQAVMNLVATSELPLATLDLPTAELDEPSTVPESDPPQEPDNYMSGDLTGDRMLRDIQTRKAGVSHWISSSAKYRQRKPGAMVNDNNARDFKYFDAIQVDPGLRELELQKPGLSLEILSLNKFLSDNMKGRMISEFIERSMESIRDQRHNGSAPLKSKAYLAKHAPNHGVSRQSESNLRKMFLSFEANRIQPEHVSNPIRAFVNQDDDSYTRWLLPVAEEATESDEVLWLLVQDENADVRFCLAENYDINPEILRALCDDENPYVAHRAHKTVSRLQKTGGTVLDHDFSSDGFQNRRSS